MKSCSGRIGSLCNAEDRDHLLYIAQLAFQFVQRARCMGFDRHF